MRQRDGRTGLRATGNVPELCGRQNRDQHFGSTTAVHTQQAAAALLQFGSPGRRLDDSAADLLPTCGQVRPERVPPSICRMRLFLFKAPHTHTCLLL